MRYKVILHREFDGGYVATFPPCLAASLRATPAKKLSKIQKTPANSISRMSWPVVTRCRFHGHNLIAYGCTFVTPSAPAFGKCCSYHAIDRSVESI